MIGGYGLYSLGELLVSGLGLAMIARYVPERMGGFMMGAYYVGVGISQYIGGLVANYAAIPSDITDPLQSLPIYTALFNKLGVVGIVCTVIALAVLPLMNKLSATHHSGARTIRRRSSPPSRKTEGFTAASARTLPIRRRDGIRAGLRAPFRRPARCGFPAPSSCRRRTTCSAR